MNCPKDGTELVVTHRSGVEIDFCPHCRGVWLDRGELNKILQRNGAAIGLDDGDESGATRGKPVDFIGELFDF